MIIEISHHISRSTFCVSKIVFAPLIYHMNLSQYPFQCTADVIMLKQQVNKTSIASFLRSLKYLLKKQQQKPCMGFQNLW